MKRGQVRYFPLELLKQDNDGASRKGAKGSSSSGSGGGQPIGGYMNNNNNNLEVINT